MNNQKKSLKILIIDDEKLIRRSLKLAGESRGHILKEAEDGVKALFLWQDFNPDLAFIDVLMPNMNGLELLEKIPKDSKTKKIIISAHNDLNEEELKKKGANLFLKKPFTDIFKLIEQAEKLCEKPNDKEQAEELFEKAKNPNEAL